MATPGQVLATLAALAPDSQPVVHADGPGAHIERRMALHRAEWDITEAFDTKWGERQTELAVELILDAQRRMSG